MREDILGILRCNICKKGSMRIIDAEKDSVEIKKGKIVCDSCSALFEIAGGIIDFLKNPSRDIKLEQDAADSEEYLWDDRGNRFIVNESSIERFGEQFLKLPEGDGSYFFKKGGSFQSIKEASYRFYDTLRRMNLKAGDRILSLGDGFGWASHRFAQHGCSAVALDISKYLVASRLYIKDAYFDRVFSDMHELPFRENTFDTVFCSAVLHHSKNLKKAFSEIHYVLKLGGRLFVLNECSRGVFERRNPLFEDLRKKGYTDTAYTIPEWIGSAKTVFFNNVKVELLSIADDYIVRQENKDARPSALLRFAYFLRSHRWIEEALLFLLSYPRVLFRPKSWRLTCIKGHA